MTSIPTPRYSSLEEIFQRDAREATKKRLKSRPHLAYHGNIIGGDFMLD
jgi:hypothetical protein